MSRAFTTEDFARRMERAAQQAAEAGLTGVLSRPGPTSLYFTGYAPIAITERITMLVVHAAAATPAMIVPILERPDAEAAPAAAALSLVDWTDGNDPYEATARAARPGRALRDLRLGLGDARARPAGARCPSRATSR